MPTLGAAILAAHLAFMPQQAAPSDMQKLLADYQAGWNSGDPRALAGLFAPDAELNSVVATAEGAANIESLYAATFAGGAGGTELTVRLDSDRAITPDTRSARGTWQLDFPASPGAPGQCGRFWTVLRKDGEAWKIVTFSEALLDCETLGR